MNKRCMAQTFCRDGVGCKFWSTDMDLDPFCVRPEALAESSGFGLNTSVMSRRGICSEANGYALHEPDDRK